MMKRNFWSIGLVASALLASLCAPTAAQNLRCCSFGVRHNFKVCLNNCPVQAVQWNWFAQASAWPPLTTNTNSGSQIYPVPSSDIKCASVAIAQDCAFATACAQFQVSQIHGTSCIQGFHQGFGRACTRCRRYGANAIAKSSIVILCGTPDATGLIQWQPVLQDVVGGECGVQNRDPVILRLRNPSTGERREIELFDLQASGFNWETQDNDGDGWADSARIKGSGPIRGNITLLKRTAGGGESRLVLRYENGIVTESANTGEFSTLPWPRVGDPLPTEIPVPATFDLPVETPPTPGWILESIEMGGDGESGQPRPIPGDVNGDGCVDDADLLAVLFAFGQTGQGLPEDVNSDGVVDDADLLIVLFNFGQGC